MVFTVVAYLPLLEEEVAHKKIEFAKKNAAEGNSSDADDETEVETEKVFEHALDYRFDLLSSDFLHITSHPHYFCFLDDKSTPPPKI